MAEMFRLGDWTFGEDKGILTCGNKRVPLENRQAQLLSFLCRNPGRNVGKEELLELWRPRVVNEDALYVCVGNLRKALGDDPRAPVYIKTVPGMGYRLVAPVRQVRPRQRHRAFVAIVGCILFAAGVAAIYFLAPKSEHRTEPPALVADDYRRARFLLTQGHQYHPAAITLLRRVMAAAPSFADAYALAAYHQVASAVSHPAGARKSLEEADAWIDHALDLSAHHPLAHLARANRLFGVDWNFPEARVNYEAALKNAGHREAARVYFDYARFLLAVGDLDRALDYTHRFQDLEPEGYGLASVAWIETMAGEYDAALASIEKLNSLDPDNFYYHVSRQAIFEQRGEEQRAFEELRWLMGRAGYHEQDLQTVDAHFANGGLAGVYGWLAREDTRQLDIGQYQPPLSLARYALGAGDTELALQWLEEAVQRRQAQVPWLGVDPKYRPLHETEAFQVLLTRLGL